MFAYRKMMILVNHLRFCSVLFQKNEKKNEGEKKAADGGGGKKDDGSTTVVLKLDLHCEGCAKKVKRSVGHFEGTGNKFFYFLLLLFFCKICSINSMIR